MYSHWYMSARVVANDSATNVAKLNAAACADFALFVMTLARANQVRRERG
jgi:hypothetical protein